jgi:hypothetical protein
MDEVKEQYYLVGNYEDQYMRWTTLRQERIQVVLEFTNTFHTLCTKMGIKKSERHLVLKYHRCYTSTLLALISVACCSQVSQVSKKAYCHDDDTKETLKMPQRLDLKEEEWLTEVKNLLPPERSFQSKVLEESAPLYHP